MISDIILNVDNDAILETLDIQYQGRHLEDFNKEDVINMPTFVPVNYWGKYRYIPILVPETNVTFEELVNNKGSMDTRSVKEIIASVDVVVKRYRSEGQKIVNVCWDGYNYFLRPVYSTYMGNQFKEYLYMPFIARYLMMHTPMNNFDDLDIQIENMLPRRYKHKGKADIVMTSTPDGTRLDTSNDGILEQELLIKPSSLDGFSSIYLTAKIGKAYISSFQQMLKSMPNVKITGIVYSESLSSAIVDNKPVIAVLHYGDISSKQLTQIKYIPWADDSRFKILYVETTSMVDAAEIFRNELGPMEVL